MLSAQPYDKLTDLQLVALCVWREARGEGLLGKRGVAHVIANRVKSPVNWWGTSFSTVVLKPYQFSSFNQSDPNAAKWPVTESESVWNDCLAAAQEAINNMNSDPTGNACWYHDKSISFPAAWGKREDYELTLEAGRLLFYRKAANNNRDQVMQATNGD